MGNRYLDWLRQAEADLRHARHALEDGDYECKKAGSPSIREPPGKRHQRRGEGMLL